MLQIVQLVWDDWNVKHIARHKISPNEVEQACSSEVVVLDGKKGRLIVLGLTKAHLLIAIVLDPEPQAGMYYPVTARTASRKERRYYIAKKGAYDKAT